MLKEESGEVVEFQSTAHLCSSAHSSAVLRISAGSAHLCKSAHFCKSAHICSCTYFCGCEVVQRSGFGRPFLQVVPNLKFRQLSTPVRLVEKILHPADRVVQPQSSDLPRVRMPGSSGETLFRNFNEVSTRGNEISALWVFAFSLANEALTEQFGGYCHFYPGEGAVALLSTLCRM